MVETQHWRVSSWSPKLDSCGIRTATQSSRMKDTKVVDVPVPPNLQMSRLGIQLKKKRKNYLKKTAVSTTNVLSKTHTVKK
jgi:hypothetical protein